MNMILVEKRDGEVVYYDFKRIVTAIMKAGLEEECAISVAHAVEEACFAQFSQPFTISDIQITVVNQLGLFGYDEIQKAYLRYANERNLARFKGSKILDVYAEINTDTHIDMKENANINSDGAMGKMLKIGSELSKEANLHSMPKHLAKFHISGKGHWHDLDFMDKTTTCCQIDLKKLFEKGFNTGHGSIRPPQRIGSYAYQAAIAIQANQNDQHGGQSIPMFDYYLAPGVRKTFIKHFKELLENSILLLLGSKGFSTENCKHKLIKFLESKEAKDLISVERKVIPYSFSTKISKYFEDLDESSLKTLVKHVWTKAFQLTVKDTYQAMEGFIHNCNTMHSRAGAQVPFSSINYGTDTSIAGRMVIEQLLLALEAGLGNGETPIFPQHIFKIKDGVNFQPTDPNYDLFQLSCRVTGKRLFPNYVNLDAPYNFKYYKAGQPETEVATMGCRTRIIGNTADPNKEIVTGRGNISFASINLPRIVLENGNNEDVFFNALLDTMDTTLEYLFYKYDLIKKKRVYNFPFLMGQGVWLDSENLKSTDEVEKVLRQGTLAIGFVGLAEALTALSGYHHGECENAQVLGLKIVRAMRKYCDLASKTHGMNITLLATPAESLSGRFLRLDRKKYGILPGITDKEYYTNSCHVPVHYNISMWDKIRIEAPYHELCNAGHITYVEVGGDVSCNPYAIEDIIRIMHTHHIGYGAINHPIDFDPVCEYTGVIKESCPKCGRSDFEKSPFESIRRITGYLTGTLNNFNEAKKAEVRERVQHKFP